MSRSANLFGKVHYYWLSISFNSLHPSASGSAKLNLPLPLALHTPGLYRQKLLGTVSRTTEHPLLPSKQIFPQVIRDSSFFNKLSADQIWKGVSGVSNAGKKRGRGRGKKATRNLNRGQVIGTGNWNMVWPGLNSPVLRGRELMRQTALPRDTERMERLTKLRDQYSSFKPLKVHPLERGYSGTKLPGRSIGAPDPVSYDTFSGFDTKVLEFKTVFCMKANFGRVRSFSCFSVTGNGNGLAGFALAKGNGGATAIRRSKNRAGQKVLYIERYNNHTIHHDFFTQFYRTKIFVKKRPKGYGLVCHRVIRTMCEMIGIRDLWAKVEGSTKNIQHICKAFFIGLLRQKSFQQLSDEKGLHLVEYRGEMEGVPIVQASPEDRVLCEEDVLNVERDFNLHVMEGQVPLKKPKRVPFYVGTPGWENHLKKTLRFRNHDKVKVELASLYGEIRSFYAEKYPECRIMAQRESTEEAANEASSL